MQGQTERAALPAGFTPQSTSFRCRFDRLGDHRALRGGFMASIFKDVLLAIF